jgi:hypothetical protein
VPVTQLEVKCPKSGWVHAAIPVSAVVPEAAMPAPTAQNTEVLREVRQRVPMGIFCRMCGAYQEKLHGQIKIHPNDA